MFTNRSGSVLITLTFLFLISESMAYPVNYQVESGYSYESPNPPDTVEKLSWWELSLRDIIIFSLAAYCPALLFPVELLFLIKVFAYFGYKRINDKIVLDNKMRLEIYSSINKNPGITAPHLAENLKVNLGTVRYHLSILEFTRKITSLSTPGFTSYYENRTAHSVMERKILQYVQNTTKVKIFHHLLELPDSSRRGIADDLGISGSSVSWHMGQLMDDQIIVARQEGKFVRYALNPKVAPIIEKYLPPAVQGE